MTDQTNAGRCVRCNKELPGGMGVYCWDCMIQESLAEKETIHKLRAQRDRLVAAAEEILQSKRPARSSYDFNISILHLREAVRAAKEGT